MHLSQTVDPLATHSLWYSQSEKWQTPLVLERQPAHKPSPVVSVVEQTRQVIAADFGVGPDQAESQLPPPAMQLLAGSQHLFGKRVNPIDAGIERTHRKRFLFTRADTLSEVRS
jgi:hypothetical protein